MLSKHHFLLYSQCFIYIYIYIYIAIHIYIYISTSVLIYYLSFQMYKLYLYLPEEYKLKEDELKENTYWSSNNFSPYPSELFCIPSWDIHLFWGPRGRHHFELEFPSPAARGLLQIKMAEMCVFSFTICVPHVSSTGAGSTPVWCNAVLPALCPVPGTQQVLSKHVLKG